MKKTYSMISIVLLSAFLYQHGYNIKWPWLLTMQKDYLYKQLTGLLMLLFILNQWHLSRLRIKNKMAEAYVELNRHRILGVMAPVIFYFHSHSLGYNYLFLLSTLYLANFTMGFLHPSVFGINNRGVNSFWIVSHVSMSGFLMLLLSQHIFISYWYE
jgi:hypothetical protein